MTLAEFQLGFYFPGKSILYALSTFRSYRNQFLHFQTYAEGKKQQLQWLKLSYNQYRDVIIIIIIIFIIPEMRRMLQTYHLQLSIIACERQFYVGDVTFDGNFYFIACITDFTLPLDFHGENGFLLSWWDYMRLIKTVNLN